MKHFLNGLVGFLLAFAVLSIFRNWSLAAITLLLALITYTFFFPPRRVAPYALLTGVLIALFLTDIGRVGREAVLGLLIYAIVVVLRDLVRFTSEYGRFIVALILIVTFYPLVMLPWAFYLVYLPQLLVTVLLAAVITFSLQQTLHPSDYELL